MSRYEGNNKAHLRPNDYDSNGDIIPDSVREDKGDTISRSALKKTIVDMFDECEHLTPKDSVLVNVLEKIDDAPSVDLTKNQAYDKGFITAMKLYARPKGEYEFIEILAQYVPDDICTYPEYKGKPYYSIHYKQNGEEFVGFGTYKPEVLSRYLKEYFMKGGAE